MDQEYITNVARNVMGELKIAPDDLEKHPVPKDFSKHVFQNVLHHIKGWNSGTLGRITAYGLGRGETSEDIPLRRTTLDDVWFGSPLETQVSGRLALGWLAATTLVAAMYDLLAAQALVRQLSAIGAFSLHSGTNGLPACDGDQSGVWFWPQAK
jgi:hypothetical protein